MLRGVFIFAGVALVERFAWLLAAFGCFLIYAGGKALFQEFCGGIAFEQTLDSCSHAYDLITTCTHAHSRSVCC